MCVCVGRGEMEGRVERKRERDRKDGREKRREKGGEGKAEGEGAPETILKGYCLDRVPGEMLKHQGSIKEIIWENFYIQPEVERRYIIHIRECRKIP